MTILRLLWYYLWIAPHALQVVVAVAMLRRKLQRQYPVFFVYMVFEIFQFSVLFAAVHLSSVSVVTYVWIYSVGTAVSTALRFGIIHEIIAQVFRNYSALNRFGKPLFRWGTVVLLLTASALAVYSGGHDPNPGWSIMWVLDRTASILQC